MSLISPNDMNYVPKRWGWELWITNTEKYCGKLLFIKQGRYCSFHWHEKKDEVLYVQQGKLWFTYKLPNSEAIMFKKLEVGHAFHVEPFVKHQMEAIEDTLILEFSTQHFDEDSFRETTDLVYDTMLAKPLRE